MLSINTISPSKIKTFDFCKFKYWLTYYRPDIQMKSNWGAEHGTVIHQILQNYVLGINKDWMSQLYDAYAGKLSATGRDGKQTILPTPLRVAKSSEYTDVKKNCDTCPYKIVNSDHSICKINGENLSKLTGCPINLFKFSVEMLKKIIKRYEKVWEYVLRDESNNIIGCEYPFKIQIPGTEVISNGFIDLVLRHNNETIEVIDYKAGKKTQSYAECLEDIQVRTYSLICRKIFIEDVLKLGHTYKNVLLTFDYFQGDPVTLAFSEEEDRATEKMIINKINEIKDVKYITRIVKNDSQLLSNWKCKSLCDINICKSEWSGPFEV